jgi:hypothetical protein
MFKMNQLEEGDYFQEFGDKGEIITRKVSGKFQTSNGLIVVRSKRVEGNEPKLLEKKEEENKVSEIIPVNEVVEVDHQVKSIPKEKGVRKWVNSIFKK